MPVRPQAQRALVDQFIGPLDLGLAQRLGGVQRLELRVSRGKLGGNRLVFGVQQAARRIDQPPARFHKACSAGQDGPLLGLQFRHRLGRLAPFQVRVAAQRAQARARGVDQHAVDLPGQALDAVVPLVRDLRRVDVGQPAARQAGLERVQPMARHIKGVEPPGVAHRRAERQRLAAGARAEVHHHLAALWREQQGQQLAALVLHLDAAAGEQVEPVQGRLALDAQAQRRERGRRRVDAGGLQLRQRLLALELEGVDPKVQRPRFVHRRGQLPEIVVAKPLLQGHGQPVRQVVAQPGREAVGADRLDLLQPGLLRRAERRAQEAVRAAPGEDGQPAWQGPAAALGQALELEPLAQHRVDRLGHAGALALAEVFVLTEEGRDGGVGRRVELVDGADQLGRQLQQGIRMHRLIIPTRLHEPVDPAAPAPPTPGRRRGRCPARSALAGARERPDPAVDRLEPDGVALRGPGGVDDAQWAGRGPGAATRPAAGRGRAGGAAAGDPRRAGQPGRDHAGAAGRPAFARGRPAAANPLHRLRVLAVAAGRVRVGLRQRVPPARPCDTGLAVPRRRRATGLR
mmetsp:Transcript_42317/g.99291  ORF Transcript_42317/g.99291 Transcript_42317/m.99291 type:complete len:573 (+) Transcript_42317:1389-3107(+)